MTHPSKAGPPLLILRDDCLYCTTRADLSLIQSIMIWPHDTKARERANSAAVAAFGVQIADALPRDELLALTKLAAEAPTIDDVNAAAADQLVHGIIAGTILRFIVHVTSAPQVVSIQDLVDFQSKHLFPQFRVQPQTIKNHSWKNWKCVSHFWAAFLQLQAEHGPTYPHPCRLDNFATFLGYAEAFRKLGEHARPRHSPGPVLRKGECVQLPSGLHVPEIILTFAEFAAT